MMLDDIDRQLLVELQANCKTPLQKLGDKVGLSAPSVMERVRKLEQAGVITGYHAVVDAKKVGLDITAFVGVGINYPKNIAMFEQGLAGIAGVLESHHVTGRYSLILKVRAKNTEALEHLISRIRGVDGVERTETMVVLSTRAERIQQPIEAPPTDPDKSRNRKRREEIAE
jgi:Lrp/AsnC family leucine-responsive transcriptional regulator